MTLSKTFTADIKKLGNCCACDTETALIPDAFKGRKNIRLIQFYNDKHEFSIDLKKASNTDWDKLKQWMENPENKFIFHNASFDVRVLGHCGIHLSPNNFECTQLMSYLIYNGKLGVSHSLADVVKRRLGEVVDKTLQAQDWMNAELNKEDLEYAMNDVRFTWRVYWDMIGQIIEDNLEIVYEIEKMTVPAIIQMESTGVKIGLIEELKEVGKSYQRRFVDELHGELLNNNLEGLPLLENGELNLNKTQVGYKRDKTYIPPGFNARAPRQVLKYFNALGIDPRDMDGKPSLDQNLLTQFKEFSIVRTYLEWKVKDKLLQMCVSLRKHVDIETDRIHPRLFQTGTATGRLSCSSPNLQNVPRDKAIRSLFIPDEGLALAVADFSTMELAAAGSDRIANVPRMKDAINNGEDLHKLTASLMYECELDEVTKEQRQNSKSVNFGALYGAGVQGLVKYFLGLGKIISNKEAEDFLNAWHKVYPEIGEWHQRNREKVRRGEPVRMVDLRRRFLSGKSAKHTTFSNNEVQGSCASVVKIAMGAIVKELPKIDPKARLVLQVHDEIMVECSVLRSVKVLKTMEKLMSEAGKEVFGDSVKFGADGGVGFTWSEAKG